jgi:hypothetical protein
MKLRLLIERPTSNPPQADPTLNMEFYQLKKTKEHVARANMSFDPCSAFSDCVAFNSPLQHHLFV